MAGLAMVTDGLPAVGSPGRRRLPIASHLAFPAVRRLRSVDPRVLIRRTSPVTTSATPMIKRGRKNLSHPAGQWTRYHQLSALTSWHPPGSIQYPVAPTGSKSRTRTPSTVSAAPITRRRMPPSPTLVRHASAGTSGTLGDGEEHRGVLQRLQAVGSIRDDKQVAVPAVPGVISRDETNPAAEDVHAGLTRVGIFGKRGVLVHRDNGLPQHLFVASDDSSRSTTASGVGCFFEQFAGQSIQGQLLHSVPFLRFVPLASQAR